MNRMVRYGWMIVVALAGAVFVTWLRAAWVGTVKVDDVVLTASQRLVIGGGLGAAFALAGWAYWQALQSEHSITIKSLLPLTLLLHGVAAGALPCTSNDLFSNLAYARMLHVGLDPYLAGPSALGAADPFGQWVGAIWWHRPMVYGPAWAALLRLLGAVRDPWVALWVFKGMSWFAACGIVALSYRYCVRLSNPADGVWRFILVVWNPVLLWEVTAQAHNDGVVALVVLVGLLAAWRGRAWAALALWGVASAIKPVLLPLLGLYGCWRLRERDWSAIAMLGIGGGAVWLAVVWWGAGAQGWFAAQGIMWQDRHFVAFSLPHLVHLLTWSCGIGTQTMLHAVVVAAQWCGMWLLAADCLRQTRSFAQVIHSTLLFLLLSLLLLMPWFQHWYLVWLLPLALMVPRWDLARLVAALSIVAVLQYASILALPRAVPTVVSVLTLNGVGLWWWWRVRGWRLSSRETA
ncbi:MAG: DUF2029 domain-containing protein [Deltaproteobacteria bacterium]|nr:DUF2029 domain-containing protein [Deltaproteobacteria bacterium]